MIELKELTDREYLLNFIANHKENETTYDEAQREFFEEGHYLFGYEVYNDGVRQGVAYALEYGGFYTMDGHNEGPRIHMAVVAGKAVCKKLLEEYSDVIYTEHNIDSRMVTLLAKKIGFKDYEQYDDRNLMIMEKNNE